MKLAIMQPYFLPYIGYFQLLACTDKFVLYDDVQFIKGGWINRNRIKVNGEASFLTIPLSNGRSSVLIKDVRIAENREFWTGKLLRTVAESYAKAPEFEKVYPLFESWLSLETESIAILNARIIEDICKYLGMVVNFCLSSVTYDNAELRAVERVLDICRIEGASHYINAIGGKALYSKERFESDAVDLAFLRPELPEYAQGRGSFIEGLSILDVLMYNPPAAVVHMLNCYTLEP